MSEAGQLTGMMAPGSTGTIRAMPATGRDAGRTPAEPATTAAVEARPGGHDAPAGVLGLQRLAGNQAVCRLLAGAAAPGAGGSVASPRLAADAPAQLPAPVRGGTTVQREDPPAAEPEARTPEQMVDDATFAGFRSWARAALADADEVLEGANQQVEVLQSPYSERLGMLVEEVTGQANAIDWGIVALEGGRPAPALADAHGVQLRFEEDLEALRQVSDAWAAVTASAVMSLIGMIAEAQVERARALVAELERLERELRDIERILAGGPMAGAFAQMGIGLAITGVLAAITFTNPIGIVAVAVGSVALQAGLDELLGPGGNDEGDVAGGTATIGGAAMDARGAARNLPAATSRLRVAGRRLGVVGAALGTFLDAREASEAVDQYEAAPARLRAVTARVNAVSRQLDPLLPLLQYPATRDRIVSALRAQAQTLRDNGQLVLAQHAQL